MKRTFGCVAAVLVFFFFAFGNAFGARDLPSDGTVLEGIFTTLYGDPHPASGQNAQKIHRLHLDSGEKVELDLSTATLPPGGLPSMVNKRIRVTGDTLIPSAQGNPQKFKVRDARPLQVPSPTPGISAVIGTQPYVSLLCKFQDFVTEPRPPSFFTTQLGNVAPGFNHYFGEASYGQLNLDGSTATATWVTLPHPKGFYIDGVKTANTYLGELFTDCTNAANSIVSFGSFFGINMMFNEKLEFAAWGGGEFANLDGTSRVWPVTWMPYWGEVDRFGWREHGVLAHEMSHSFGATHSESPDGNEYGNWWDVVSKPGAACTTIDVNYGCLGQQQIAYTKTVMGFMPASRIANHLFGSQAYNVERLDQPPNVGGTFSMLRVNIPGSLRYYSVESRFRIGYDGQLLGDGVLIHEVDPVRATGNPPRLVVPGGGTAAGLGDLDAIWPVGSTFNSIADHVNIAINSFSGTGTANVAVTTPAAADTFPPNCVLPAGWSTPGGATTGWSIAIDSTAAGSCSLKSNPMGDSPTQGPNNKAQIQFQGTFSAGNVTFQRRVSSESTALGQKWDCFRFYIDGAVQSVGGTCNYTVAGSTSGLAGEIAWGPASFPVTAGAHTLTWSYEKDEVNADGADAAWIDSVVMPVDSGPGEFNFAQAAYSVNEAGGIVTISVTRSPSFTNAASVTWTTADGTANAGQDFGTLGSSVQRTGVLNWAAGDGAAKTFTVPILQDTLVESAETFTVALSSPTGGVTLGATSSTTVTINDDDSFFDFASPTVSLAENGPNIVLTVTRSGTLTTSANVTYTTSNGTALVGTDFGTLASIVQPTGVITFGAGVSSRNITIGPAAAAAPYIPVINDTVIEGPKSFNVVLSAPTGGGHLGATTTAAVTINSEESGITMNASTLSVAESVGSAQVQVNRAGSTTGAASVNYTFANSTAVNGTHYTGVAGTLTWPIGDGTPKFIPVTIIDNAVVNASRMFTVMLSAPVGAAIGTPASTAVTITDNDNTLQFSPASYTVSEAIASVSLTVSRLGGAAGAASVNWATTDGSANVGSDYGILGNATPLGGVLNWGAGDAASKTISIPILNDALIEGNENFTVTLSGAGGTGTSLGAAIVATVTITDNDVGVSFALPAYTVIESGPMITVPVTRIGDTAGAIGVTWTTSNGSAMAGQDFGTNGNPAQRSGMLSWIAGDALPKNITVGPGGLVPIINDTAFEPTESFTITLSAPTGGAALGPTPSTTINITDDESTFAFSAPAINVSEAGPNVTLQVARTGSLATAATVRYTTANGTALLGSDFGATGATLQPTAVLSFAAGDASPKTITIGPLAAAAPYIPVINDTVIEGPETFTITLSAPTGGGQLGAPSVATVTIDSDDKGIAMGAATRSVAENAGSMNVQVVRAGPATGAISVNYTFANGTAMNGTHYGGVNGTLNWADGDAAPKDIPVVVANDAAVNPNRTFTVTLSGAIGATIGAPTSTAVTIVDDDNNVQFASPIATVAEGTAALTLSVTRIGGVANPASVSWATTDGTALAGSDFGALGNATPVSGVLNWGAGDAAAKSVSIPILNDLIVEGAKTFTVNLSGPAGATMGTVPTVTVTLNDNDSGVVFSIANYTVLENAGNVTLTVNRIGPATMAASVMWTTANGSATAGQDFGTLGSAVQRTGVLSWLAGNATPKTIVIPIINDAVNEGDETFTVVLSAPSTGIVLGAPSTATVTITDDDIPPESELAFTQPKYLVLENAPNVVLTVNRNIISGFGRAASVHYATQAGTALATSDYTTTSGTLTWPIGDSAPKTITVPIINDTVAESSETFKVLLSAVTPGTSIATPETTVLIVDDDEVFPLQGAFPVNWTTPGGATQGWIVSNDPGPYEGVYSLRTETISDNETSQVEVAGTFVAGTVSFRLRISSEANFDFLRFYVDGVPLGQWSGTANTAWQLYSTPLTAGAHTLRWSYEKDASASLGQDAAWIDAVTMPAYNTP